MPTHATNCSLHQARVGHAAGHLPLPTDPTAPLTAGGTRASRPLRTANASVFTSDIKEESDVHSTHNRWPRCTTQFLTNDGSYNTTTGVEIVQPSPSEMNSVRKHTGDCFNVF